MKEIEFDAHFGDVKKKLKLMQPTGASDLWQVIIDNYYQGILLKRDGKWEAHLNANCDLNADDITALGERIDNHC